MTFEAEVYNCRSGADEARGSVNHFRKLTKKDSRKAEGHSGADEKSGERPKKTA